MKIFLDLFENIFLPLASLYLQTLESPVAALPARRIARSWLALLFLFDVAPLSQAALRLVLDPVLGVDPTFLG